MANGFVSCPTAFRIWICRSQVHGAFERSATGALVGGMSVQGSQQKCESQRILEKEPMRAGDKKGNDGRESIARTDRNRTAVRERRTCSVRFAASELFLLFCAQQSREAASTPPHLIPKLEAPRRCILATSIGEYAGRAVSPIRPYHHVRRELLVLGPYDKLQVLLGAAPVHFSEPRSTRQ